MSAYFTVALYLFFPFLIILAALSDLTRFRLPNWISLGLLLAFLGVTLSIGLSVTQLVQHGLAFLLVLSMGFTLFAFGYIGGGDAKFAAAIALWMGLDATAAFLLISCLFGGVLAVGTLVFRRLPLPVLALRIDWVDRLYDGRQGVPYGIALASGGLYIFPHTEIFSTLVNHLPSAGPFLTLF